MSKIYTSYTEHFEGRNGHAAGVSWRGPERRAETRMHIPLHVKVCGNTAEHEAFEIEGVVDNISRSGLYVVAGEALAVGTKLLIFMRPLSVKDEDDTTPFGIMRGEVKRVVRQADGTAGLGIAINHRRQHSPES